MRDILIVVLILALIIVGGMYLQAQNGQDIFTMFWTFVESLATK